MTIVGKWTSKEVEGTHMIYDEAGELVARVSNEIHARLVKGAPELKAALQEMRDVLKTVDILGVLHAHKKKTDGDKAAGAIAKMLNALAAVK